MKCNTVGGQKNKNIAPIFRLQGMLNKRKVLILALGEEWGIDRIWDERTFK